ncbi:MAG: carbon starvation protein A [Candidatus Aminicenantes bacterium]|nr:carbon starvation protein A [Candidatus Aminicenantes bacterium]
MGSAALFVAAYFVYGRFLARRFALDDSRPTPCHTDCDGVDRVPAQRAVLLGHHFSSIAGAGPIVGPIIASLAFGWLPALIWIILGSIFIGGVHDFSALVASIRNRGCSIAEVARRYMSPLAYKLFLAFIWLALVYVLTVFLDLTSTTFVGDGGVATSSLIYILLAVAFGQVLYRLKVRLLWASLVFVPLVFLTVWVGQLLPIQPDALPKLAADGLPWLLGGDPAKAWNIVLIIYCFIASTTPVWALLQPRDYLSSYLLYASVLAGFVGILFGGFAVRYAAFTGWSAPQLGTLFPLLFITIACGACSGFHAIVASGTSSKQLNREGDARPIGYGSMLVEGLVAVIALATVILLARGDPLTGRQPLEVYGHGIGRFLETVGLPYKFGFHFGLLALSTFILTTLDTATRLGRYAFEEFFGVRGKRTRYLSALATLVLPAVFVLITLRDAQGNPMPAWRVIWPVFGATNQLLAGLTLVAIMVWLKREGRKLGFLVLPTLFMLTMTLWALVLLFLQYRFRTIGAISLVLLGLAGVLIFEAARSLFFGTSKPAGNA